ncbi:phasin family protein [Microvirga calopogonii]|uniref:phasin family protein n=1 Tax=Microvirga calopogonii TaxID=2078013 RepID=UPI000E0DF536|nr:phasin family protein [Microvirga calopogonii]
MTTIQTRSGVSDTLRSGIGIGIAVPDGGGQALSNATEAWFSASAECQREMIGFVSMRLEKDGEIAREMIACKSLADVAAIQSRWMEETLQDYNAELGRLMTICTKSVNGGSGAKG